MLMEIFKYHVSFKAETTQKKKKENEHIWMRRTNCRRNKQGWQITWNHSSMSEMTVKDDEYEKEDFVINV